jgi:hypothetical protein
MEGTNENQIYDLTVFTASCSPLKICIYSKLKLGGKYCMLHAFSDSSNHFLDIS